LKFSPFLGLLVFLSHAPCLERISCGWFADFGWIFLQLGLNALGFLDELSKYVPIFGFPYVTVWDACHGSQLGVIVSSNNFELYGA
jgi:hypothetical protein